MSDLDAVMKGLSMGKLALSGLVPSGQSPRGGPPPADPCADRYKSCVADLNALAQCLQRYGRPRRAVEIQDMAVKLQRMAIDDQDDMLADATSDSSGGSSAYGANFPNVNGGGVI